MAQLLSEDILVRRIERAFRGSRSAALRLALGDDAALWRPTRGHEMILTSDQFLESTHFLRDKHPADAVGWKCLARAVSDIAAMGGVPRCFLLSLALPASLTGRWLDRFLAGLRRASRTMRCELAGGDTTQRDEILINVTVIGEARTSHAVLRSGAAPGDVLFVSGVLGGADLGLQELRRGRGLARVKNAALRKHLYPEPRLALGQWLASRRLATAMMDLSDGLSSDLPRLCAASGVGARIASSALPCVPRLARAESVSLALNGGDDYELLFTVPQEKAATLPARFGKLPLTRVGTITKRRKITLVTESGEKPLAARGWDPFQKRRGEVHSAKDR